MNILTNVLNQFGANLTNLVAVALAGLIDENAIAREIERKLNEDKQEGLAKPTAAEEE